MMNDKSKLKEEPWRRPLTSGRRKSKITMEQKKVDSYA